MLNRARRSAQVAEEGIGDDPPSLHSLTLKILHFICRYMSSIGLRRFRLVCRLFSDIVMRHLATGAYPYPTKLSLRRLVNLSQTELRKSITSLYIAGEHFDSCYTFEEWECLKVPPTWFDEYPRGSTQSKYPCGKYRCVREKMSKARHSFHIFCRWSAGPLGSSSSYSPNHCEDAHRSQAAL
jgi:hypothetical protein